MAIKLSANTFGSSQVKKSQVSTVQGPFKM